MLKKENSFKVKLMATVLALLLIVGAGPIDLIGSAMARSENNSTGGAVLRLSTEDVLKTVERVAGAQAAQELQNSQETEGAFAGIESENFATASISVEQSDTVVPKDTKDNEVTIEQELPQVEGSTYYVDQEMEQFVNSLDIPADSKLMEKSILDDLQDLWFIKSYSSSDYQAVAMLNPNTLEVQVSFINSGGAQKEFTLDVVDEQGNPVEITELSAIINRAAKRNITAEELEAYKAQDGTSVEILAALAENKVENPTLGASDGAATEEPTAEEPVVAEEPTTEEPIAEKPAIEEAAPDSLKGELVAVEAVIVQSETMKTSGSVTAPRYNVPAESVFTGTFGGITPFGLNHTVEFFIDGQPYGEKVWVAAGTTIAEEPAPPHSLWPENTTAFNGWFLDGETKKFDFLNTEIDENIRLYAKFSNIFNVAYKNSEGTILETKPIQPNAPIPAPGDEVISKLNPPEGKRLVYWYDESGSDRIPFVFGTAATHDIVLRPYFSNEFYVIFMSEGTQVNPQSVIDGGKAVEPIGKDIPTRDGFTFKYWATEANGGTDKKFSFNTAITDNIILYAVWEAKTVDYTVIYWVEKANFIGDPGNTRANYNHATSVVQQGTAGTAITVDEATADSYIASITGTVKSQNPLRYSKFGHGDENVTLAGNGSTTINIYYKRIEYTYEFYVNENIGTELLPSHITYAHNDTKIPVSMDTNKPSYTIQAKFQQDVAAYWPTIEKSVLVAENTMPNGWLPDAIVGDSSVWVTSRYLITTDMINQTNPKNENDYICELKSYWVETNSKRYAEYWLETLDGSGTLPTGLAASIAAIKNHDFTRKTEYDQTLAYYNSTLNPKGLDGFEKDNKWFDGSDGAGATKKFYYLRNKSDIIFDAKGGRIDAGGSPVAVHTIKNVFYDMPLASYKPADPTRTGYTFAGWYKDDEYNEAFDLATEKMPKDELRLYANWEATEFDVTYHDRLGNSTVLESHGYGRNEYVKHPATLYNKGDKVAGFGEFEGWFWIVPGTNIFTEFSLDIPVSSDIDLYATWKTAGFNVEYEVGRGSGTAPQDQEVYDIGRNVALKVATGITPPAGEVFYGWWPQNAAPNELYYPRNLYSIQGDTKFIAQFGSRENAFQLTFDPGYDGSTEAPLSWYVPKNASVYLLDGAFTHPNASIIGWSETKNATVPQYNFEELVQINSNKVLYAVWNIKSYNVYFQTDVDKGELLDPGVVASGIVKYADIPFGTAWSAAISRGVPQVKAKAGYYFTGWSPAIPAGTSVINSDKTYVAQYKNQTAVTLTADNATKPYDGTPLTSNAVKTANLDTNVYKVTATMTAGSTITNAGTAVNTIQTYKITEIDSGENVTDRFAVKEQTGKLVVTKANVTITANDKTMTFGGTLPAFDSKVEGKPTKGVPVNYKTTCGYTNQGVGDYPIIASESALNPNYTVTYVNGTLTVTQNESGMTAKVDGDKTVVYDGNAHKIDVVVNGPTSGYKVKYSTTAGGTYDEAHPIIKDVGTSTVYFEVTHKDYKTVKGSGKLIITPANVKVTADNKSTTFGTAAPALTGTVSDKPANGVPVNYKTTTSYVAGNDVGSYPIAASESTPNPNYNVTYVPGTLTVTQSQEGMTAEADAEKIVTYDGDAHEIDVVVTGATGYTIKYSATAGGSYIEAHPSMINVADGGMVYFEVTHPNYYPVRNSGKLTIKPAKVTVTANDKTMTFGGTLPAFDSKVEGKPTKGDDVNYKTTCGYTNQGVGDYPIIASESALNPNYTVTYVKGTLKVEQGGGMTAGVKGDKTVVYDGDPHKIDVVVTGPTSDVIIKYSATAGGSYNLTHPIMKNVLDTGTVYFEVTHKDYKAVKGEGKLIITPANVKVTADNKVTTFGAAAPALTGKVTDKPTNGVPVNHKETTSYVIGNNVGDYPIVAEESALNPNYNVTYVNGTLKVTKAGGMGAKAVADKIVTYNGNTHEIVVDVVGPTSGYTIKYSDKVVGPFSETQPSMVNVGDYIVYFEITHPNYHTAAGEGKIIINPANVTVTANDKTMAFGGTLPAFDGRVDGKPTNGVPVNYKTTCGYTNQGVGDYPIIASEKAPNPNYNVTYVKGNLAVTQNENGMTAKVNGDKTVVYDGNAHKIDVVVNGPTSGYKVKYSTTAGGTYDEAHPIIKDVGTSTVYFEVSHPNYASVKGSGKLIITKANVTVTADNKSTSFGTAAPALTGTVSSKPANGVAVNHKETTSYVIGNDVGDYPIVAEESAPNPNYNVTYVNGTLNVKQSEGGMTAKVNGDKTVVYNGEAHEIDVVVNGPASGYKIQYSTSSTGTYTDTHPSLINVGTSTVYFEVTHKNYKTVRNSGKLIITKANVTVTADNKSTTFGTAAPALTGTVTGKPANGVAVSHKATTIYTIGSNIGTYPIVAMEDALNPNYNVTYVSGILTVKPSESGMTAGVKGDKTVVYDGNAHKIDVVVNGPTSGYKVKYSTTAGGTYDEAHPIIKDVGTSTVYFEVSHPNYASVKGSGKLIITKANVTVTADNKSTTFALAAPALTGTVSSKPANGVAVNHKETTSYVIGNDAGQYSIIAMEDAPNPNYNVTYVNGTLTVGKASGIMTVSALDKTVTYNASTHKIDVMVSGATGYTVKYSKTAAGTYTATHPSMINVADSGKVHFEVEHKNFTTVKNSATLTIGKMAITVKADNKGKPVGAADPTLTATVSPALPAGASPVDFTLSRTAGEVANTSYPIVVTALAAKNPNYTITTVNGALTISKIQLVVKVRDTEKLANGRDPGFVGDLISGKLDGKDRLNQIGIKYTRVPGEVVGKKYAINGSIVSDKYEVQFIPGKLTINPSSVNR